MHRNKFRVALALLGVLGTIFAPPWVPLLIMGLLSLRFRAWEVLAIGLLMDFLWLPGGPLFHPLPLFTLASIVLVWGLEPVRSQFLITGRGLL